MDYKQPDFYHFNQDSIDLAKYAATQMKSKNQISVLDLCAGCGVVGLELSKLLDIRSVYFLELQSEFFLSLKENILNFACEILTTTDQRSLSHFKTDQKFDLIVANPPYFLKGGGRTGLNANRQKCRFFEEDSYHVLVSKMRNSLRPEGIGLFLGRIENSEILEMLSTNLIELEVKLASSDTAIYRLTHKIFKK